MFVKSALTMAFPFIVGLSKQNLNLISPLASVDGFSNDLHTSCLTVVHTQTQMHNPKAYIEVNRINNLDEAERKIDSKYWLILLVTVCACVLNREEERERVCVCVCV